MSKNTNLSFLTDYITADITNGRIGINNASPTYSFDVTGIARTSTSTYLATASGNVGIGTTSPSGELHVKAISGFSELYIQGSSSTSGMYLFDQNTESGLWKVDSGYMAFGTTNAERMRITSAGLVGIGTSSPTARLEVYGGESGMGQFTLAGTYGGIMRFAGSGVNKWAISVESGLGSDKFGIFSYGASAYVAVITTAGNVGIGTSSPSVLLHAKTTGDGYNMLTIESTSGDAGIALKGGTGGTSVGGFTIQGQNGGSMVFVDRNSTPATRMTISSNGSIGAPSGTNIYNASDVRLKKNISTTTYGLDTISALNPVKFNWVDGFEPTEDGKDMLGFVAQEVQQVIPEAIESFGENSITIGNTEIDNPLRVNEKFIIPVLVKAIQELKAEIETLKQK